MVRHRLHVLLALWLLVLCAGPSAAATSQQVTLRTQDGLTIAGTLYLPSRQGPAVVLLHMLTRSREDWHALGTRLADAGIVALAIDLRGHGASDPPPAGTAPDLAGMQSDIKAARAFLAGRPEVAGGRIGYAGASIGANLAVIAAAGDTTVRSLALLSPGADYRGLRTEAALERYGQRPALLVGSQEDNYVMISVRRLSDRGAGTREQLVLNGAGHGTTMLQRQPDIVATLVDWFKRTLL